jgi:hypothetical protein
MRRDPQPEKWSKVDDQAIPKPVSLIWASNTKPCFYIPNAPELAVHGVREADYKPLFDRAVKCGYHPDLVDGYEYSDLIYYNAIFHYDPSRDEVSKNKQNLQHFNETRQDLESKGYRLIFVDSYNQKAHNYFSSVYVRDGGPATKVTPNLTPADHDSKLDQMAEDGWVPIQVSAYTLGPGRFITTLYEKRSVGVVLLKSHLSESEYNALVAENEKKHMALVYVNAYVELGYTPRYAAIWHQYTSFTSIAAPHKMSTSEYQTNYNKYTGQGLWTRAVTGYEQHNKMVFEAIWAK